MTKAIVIRNLGGPEGLKLEDVPLGAPGPGEDRPGLDAHRRHLLHRAFPLSGIPALPDPVRP